VQRAEQADCPLAGLRLGLDTVEEDLALPDRRRDEVDVAREALEQGVPDGVGLGHGRQLVREEDDVSGVLRARRRPLRAAQEGRCDDGECRREARHGGGYESDPAHHFLLARSFLPARPGT
jgi:hypothetical protein